MNHYRWTCCVGLVGQLVWFGILSCANGEEKPASLLPLTLSVTKTPFDSPPDYFGGERAIRTAGSIFPSAR